MEVTNVSVAEARRRVVDGATLLDVREPDEWRLGRAEGALHVPLGELPDRFDELPDGPLVCVCRSGARSLVAARFLASRGRDAVNLDGGMVAWALDGAPLVADHDHPTVG